jgi:hypothetical protein
MDFTQDQVNAIVREARDAAYAAADEFFRVRLGGVDQYACGFAWVNIYGHNGKQLKGNTKMGRAMKAAGVRQDYTRAFQIWNPSGHNAQNVDTKEAGARAAADVLKKYGFTAYAGSRLD